MCNYKSLQCCYCNSVIITLSEAEISKLDGLNFTCECCGHQNLLIKSEFHKGTDIEDPYLNTFSCENFT